MLYYSSLMTNSKKFEDMTTEEISDYLFLEDEDQSGDLALVVGIRNWMGPWEKSRQLYWENGVDRIMFSGGFNKISSEPEARNLYQTFLQKGASESEVFLEENSDNILENIKCSHRFLEEKGLLEQINTICAVTVNFNARRARMTLKKHMPEGMTFKSCPYNCRRLGVTKDNWAQTKIGHIMVKDELEKIKFYLERGDIEEL